MQPSEYLLSDLVWCDPLNNVADAAVEFSVTKEQAPQGWRVQRTNGWMVWTPQDHRLPAQGWKIHVSVRLDEADDAIRVVRDYCVAHQVAFKFLRSRTVYVARNDKYASRGSSGKLCTIYPADENQLEAILSGLSGALKGRRGPYILSDLRWGEGPLYVRYGAFVGQFCVSRESGEYVPALRDGEQKLVPDQRGVAFHVPPWVSPPQVVADEIARVDAEEPEDLPWQVESVLHFSNGGGIYLASDSATGRNLVIREARPHAGLNAHHADAVQRLLRERDVLQKLSGTGVAPEYVDYRQVWEHHFLVEEHIDGVLLQHEIASRYPLIYPDPTPDVLAEYRRWALDMADRLERVLATVHEHGLVFGDLHPMNIIVRDGQPVLIDFEECFDATERRSAGLGALGFVAPWRATGQDGDRYALTCIKLALFLPLTPMISLDPDRAKLLVGEAAHRFELPEPFVEALLRDLAPPTGWDKSAWLKRRPGLSTAVRRDPENDDAWLSSMTEAILASATPDRSDRLFPGDAQQFEEGGISLAHGAAGVLYALHATGCPPPAEHIDWLATAALRWKLAPPGLYGGLHGVAATLAMLGRPDGSHEVFTRAGTHHRVRQVGLYHGLAGVGLAYLHLGRDAEEIAQRLRAAVTDAAGDHLLAPSQPGLMHGWSGVAIFFIRMFETTGQESYLDAAETALARDLSHCVRTRSGGLQIEHGIRLLEYLATGSSGIGLALREFQRHRGNAEFDAALPLVQIDLAAEFVMLPGLFEGRAGLMLAASALGGVAATAVVKGHQRRLAWHEVSYRGHATYPGLGMRRLSIDLATGTAGVLLAAHQALRSPGPLPFLGPTPDSVSSTADTGRHIPSHLRR